MPLKHGTLRSAVDESRLPEPSRPLAERWQRVAALSGRYRTDRNEISRFFFLAIFVEGVDVHYSSSNSTSTSSRAKMPFLSQRGVDREACFRLPVHRVSLQVSAPPRRFKFGSASPSPAFSAAPIKDEFIGALQNALDDAQITARASWDVVAGGPVVDFATSDDARRAEDVLRATKTKRMVVTGVVAVEGRFGGKSLEGFFLSRQARFIHEVEKRAGNCATGEAQSGVAAGAVGERSDLEGKR